MFYLGCDVTSSSKFNEVQDTAVLRAKISAKFRPRLILCPSPSSSLVMVPLYQKSGKTTVVPAAIFDLQPSPIPTPVIRGGEIPVGLRPPSNADSAGAAGILLDHVSYTPRSPSKSSTKTRPYTPQWPSSVLHSPVMSSRGALSVLVGTSGVERPIPMAVISNLSQLSPLALTSQLNHTPHG